MYNKLVKHTSLFLYLDGEEKMKKANIINWPSLKDAGNRKKIDIVTRNADLNITENLKNWSKGKTFCLLTYGCQANVRDSEILKGYFQLLNMTETDDEVKADVVLFN